jgi:hypothetical protein
MVEPDLPRVQAEQPPDLRRVAGRRHRVAVLLGLVVEQGELQLLERLVGAGPGRRQGLEVRDFAAAAAAAGTSP